MLNYSTRLTTIKSEILLASVSFKFIAMIFGVLGNVTVLRYTLFTSREKTATSYLIGNLALADLLLCLTFHPIWITEFIQAILSIDTDQDLFCKLSRSTMWAFLFASVATLLVITVDRYVFIVKPLLYPQIVTRRKVFLAISGIWFTACFLFGVLYAHSVKCPAGLRSVCYLDIFKKDLMVVNISVGCLPLVAIFALNFQIFNVARKQRKRILAEKTAISVDTSNEQSSKRLIRVLRFLVGLKAAKTFGVVVMIFALCVVVPTLVGLTQKFSCTDTHRQIWLVVVQYEFYGINSIVNAFIYGMRHIRYRRAYQQILYEVFGCKKLKEHCSSV